jgi:hypothetical protein
MTTPSEKLIKTSEYLATFIGFECQQCEWNCIGNDDKHDVFTFEKIPLISEHVDVKSVKVNISIHQGKDVGICLIHLKRFPPHPRWQEKGSIESVSQSTVEVLYLKKLQSRSQSCFT